MLSSMLELIYGEFMLTIDYEQKYWNILEEYAELLQFLQEKAPLTYQAFKTRELK